jgi:rod shape-determining protein MreB
MIVDVEALQRMLSYFLNKVCTNKIMLPKVLISVPPKVTPTYKKTVVNLLKRAGSGEVKTIEEPLAAAKGADMKRCMMESCGQIMVNIGGGTTNIAIISRGEIIVSQTVRGGGKEMDNIIRSYVKREKKLLISRRMAESIKIELGYAMPLEGRNLEERIKKVRGSTFTGPHSAIVSGGEIYPLIRPIIDQIIGSIRRMIENVSPEIASDLASDGFLMLSGGLAPLPGLKELIEESLNLRVEVAKEPEFCVIKGISKYLSEGKFRDFN